MADTFGWHDFVHAVDRAWRTLDVRERAHAAVWASNYGEASALALYSQAPDLHIISTHNEWWRRGYAPWDGSSVLLIRDLGDVARGGCASLRDLGTIAMPSLAMPYERARHIYLCRGVHVPLAKIWASEKHYY